MSNTFPSKGTALITGASRGIGAVYADGAPGEEYRFDPEAIALLTYLAGLLIERLPARKLRPLRQRRQRSI